VSIAYSTLKLPESTEAELTQFIHSMFLVSRRQQEGRSVQKTIRLQGKDLEIFTPPENAETEKQDKKHGQKRS